MMIILLSALLCILHTDGVHSFISFPSIPEGRNHRVNNIFATKGTGIIFDIGVCNIPGVDWQRPGKVNQDSWFIDYSQLPNGHNYTVYGVLDGHGKYGHEISSFAAKNLPIEIYNQLIGSRNLQLPESIIDFESHSITNLAGFNCSEYKSTCTETQQSLINAFHSVHYGAMKDENVKSGRNGATCIACLLDNDNLECNVAYVGDSRGMYFNNDGNSESITVIANEQTVDILGERQRIESREGSIRGKNVFYGPVGIAMTRALGDAVMIRAGVIPTPMVESFQLCRGDTLILATDGIWDVLSNEQVKDISVQRSSAQDAADAIADNARKRWIGDLPIMDEVKADDITVLVLRL